MGLGAGAAGKKRITFMSKSSFSSEMISNHLAFTKARSSALNHTFQIISALLPAHGKRVYEIGCDPHFISAKKLVLAGAQSVVATNFSNIDQESIADWPSIRFVKGDASNSTFEDGAFDIIYGRAVLEHIPNFTSLISETARLLSPGGFVFIEGAPMWTCSNGHHLWVDGPSGAKYRMNENSPIQDWEHLTFTHDAMLEKLVRDGIPPADAKAICHYVYERDTLNRLSPSQILDAVSHVQDLPICGLRFSFTRNPPPLIDGFQRNDLLTNKLLLFGCKSTNVDAAKLHDHAQYTLKLAGIKTFL